MRKNGILSYIFGDHLGSTSLITNESGNLVSETKYKACPLAIKRLGMLREGEIRYSSGANPTDYTFTGQFSYADDFGLMFYNARWYDPSLGRFAQADTIVPSGVQGYDRYAYVNNSPVIYTDPSGHKICDEEFGCDGESGGWNPLMGCKLNCTIEDLDDATMQERLRWLRWLTNHMDENIREGTSEWFNNIDAVVDSFIWSGQDDNQ
ncbi:MAG: YD repeat-/RHS repeat-containing protein, partial [Chloroflexi bacterium OLB14]